MMSSHVCELTNNKIFLIKLTCLKLVYVFNFPLSLLVQGKSKLCLVSLHIYSVDYLLNTYL